MDLKTSSKKVANNILEFLVDPSAFPLERRLYFRPEEILQNESFEKAKKESQKAYGDQHFNSDFYPNRPLIKREATSSMERKTLIASLDVLSQELIENHPIAKDLRTMAYAVAKMSDEEFEGKVARQEEPAKEATTDVEEAWTKEASDAVSKALVAEITGEEVEAASACEEKKKEEEAEKTADCGKCEEDEKGKKAEEPVAEEKEATEEPAEEKEAAKEVVEEEATEEVVVPEKKKAEEASEESKEATEEETEKEATEEKAEEKEATKEPTEVDTEVLDPTSTFGDIQLEAGMQTMEDIGDMSEDEQNRLNQLFQ